MNMYKQRPQVLSEFCVLVLVMLAVLPACGSRKESMTEQKIRYRDMEVRRGMFRSSVSANGVVRPIERVEVKSKASGQIEECPVEEGDFIRKGDLIARLDQKEERAEVAQARADLDIAKAELDQAEKNFERKQQLYEQNLISENERDQVELSLAQARGKLIRATTTLERAEERFAESIVRAPLTGMILQKYVEEGQIIASGVNNVSGGTPIVDMADMDFVFVEAGINEIDIGNIRTGQKVFVTADAYPDNRFHGEIVRMAPEARIEQNVTLFDVVVKVENREGFLKSGMNAAIEITLNVKRDVLLVPTNAVMVQGGRKDPGKKTVMIKRGEEYVPGEVETGLSNFQVFEIVSGLEEGDTIGIPMKSRLKDENDRWTDRIRNSRNFGKSPSKSKSN